MYNNTHKHRKYIQLYSKLPSFNRLNKAEYFVGKKVVCYLRINYIYFICRRSKDFPNNLKWSSYSVSVFCFTFCHCISSPASTQLMLIRASRGQYLTMAHQLWVSCFFFFFLQDQSWSKGNILAADMPSWSDDEHRGEAGRGSPFSTAGRDLDLSPERRWHLTELYRLFLKHLEDK